MESLKCDISFKLEYESSDLIGEATAYYKPSDSDTEIPHNIIDDLDKEFIKLPINSLGSYDLRVKLSAGAVSDEEKIEFIVGKCATCEPPKVHTVDEVEYGQLVINYFADPFDLITLEYQIALDKEFKHIIHSKVGFDNPSEYIDMNDAKLPDGKLLYIRMRRYCKSKGIDVISVWSDVLEFKSGEWKDPLECYWLAQDDDTGPVMCNGGRGYSWKTRATYDTPVPKKGSTILLPNLVPALKENIRKFLIDAEDKYKTRGLGYIRFVNVTPDIIYSIKRDTAEIEDTKEVDCTST
ncbi:hypothetical protein BBI01_02000 [Chryseobacterium artocarpi]|uniref:Uncharacterized protein n=1 Tax=Chryseobacterium artocarpi TaxID=1414727 RepID=A0A1B9A078_9FLAO|nr:hypothetical protein [Chryseobacterium artocarpi]OCA77258.1 hypothetical protein BBI01_02000 [Chryseobacterium artocarpi]